MKHLKDLLFIAHEIAPLIPPHQRETWERAMTELRQHCYANELPKRAAGLIACALTQGAYDNIAAGKPYAERILTALEETAQ